MKKKLLIYRKRESNRPVNINVYKIAIGNNQEVERKPESPKSTNQTKEKKLTELGKKLK